MRIFIGGSWKSKSSTWDVVVLEILSSVSGATFDLVDNNKNVKQQIRSRRTQTKHEKAPDQQRH